MPSTTETAKAALLSEAATAAGPVSRRSRRMPPGATVAALLDSYYLHVSVDDIADRAGADLFGALASHLSLAAQRPQGTARVRVSTPRADGDGWSAGRHSVVEIVTDDMPFLVDSITMALGKLDHTVHLIIHPQFEVERKLNGELTGLNVPADDSATASSPTRGWTRESWMHVEIDRVVAPADTAAVEEAVQSALRDVKDAYDDWQRMRARLVAAVEEVKGRPPPGLPDEEVSIAVEFLRWLAEDHFVFLGYREYRRDSGSGPAMAAVPGSGLGVLRNDPRLGGPVDTFAPPIRTGDARETRLLALAKANVRSTVHRPSYLDYVAITIFGDSGQVVGERRFLGLFSAAAYTESVKRIPLLREKVHDVLATVGFVETSHSGKAMLNVLENYPRDELFYTSVEELVPIAEQVMLTRERRQLRLFTRRDRHGRYVSCLIYLPQDQYNTGVREKLAAILTDSLGAESVEFSVRMNESLMAQVHFVARPPDGEFIGAFDQERLESELSEAARSWKDDFGAAVTAQFGEEDHSRQAPRLTRLYLNSFPEAYKEDFTAAIAAVDLTRLEAIDGADGIAVSVYTKTGDGEVRFKLYRVGEPVSLSRVLPILSSMGVEVTDERPYELENLPRPSHVYDFGLRCGSWSPRGSEPRFVEAFHAAWDGRVEVDGFNSLVLVAGLGWRQISVLRGYAKYMRQGGTPYSTDYIVEALTGNVDLARLIVELFEARFDPEIGAPARESAMKRLEAKIDRALDDVVSLDHDRILRSYRAHVSGTLRTNYYRRPAGATRETGEAAAATLSFKLDPANLPDLPRPRPAYEIFVYSPRVEGVHLRFGAVARGGLRWSDRRDDFRTEVLGLVKAQMVKNTVIVPVGAKGGFVCKQLPDPGDREAWLAEGKECYRLFVSSLLDLTDNLVDGRAVPPPEVIRHDGDDAYLVVAADKGTATFSDIANEISVAHGFWLGDAFASGGSVGYDHKQMGITARGAWVSVRRHFREMGVDCQAEDITCVGVGDMSGDVFGNGMLCSEHIRLVAAFDHRDIFVDPDPDAAASYAERKRLFGLPRSSWTDYDPDSISAGGGVFSRSAKSVAITSQMRHALGIDEDVTSLTPTELMKVILHAPVDLLWNGGIGTYVKAGTETHADAGDKSNDAIRIDGSQVRARCVAEGGNLGLTQLGRIEYASAGARGPDAAGTAGRINTDFIDNSAGVDTSDHEVNIKILLDRVVSDGALSPVRRNSLLAKMTEEVGELVLRDNYEHNVALANAAANAPDLLHVHAEMITAFERDKVIDRKLEGLPTVKEIRDRLERSRGLTGPELSVVMAWTKIVLAQQLVASGLPDDPFLEDQLFGYFPTAMRRRYRDQMLAHPLRREIVVTQVVNDLVNGAGMTFLARLGGETGASAVELTAANLVARQIFGSRAWNDELSALDNRIDAAVQTRLRIEMRTLIERASRWLVTRRRAPLDGRAVVGYFETAVRHTLPRLADLMTGRELSSYEHRRDRLVERGAPPGLAARAAALSPGYMLLGIVDNATRHRLPAEQVARTHFAIGEHLGLPDVLGRIIALPRDDRWQTMARAALREELYDVHSQLTHDVLRVDPPGKGKGKGKGKGGAAASAILVEDRIAAWAGGRAARVSRAIETVSEICADDSADLARMSVALRAVKGLLAE
ncbi:MAG: NAD-glutamate dehydrogenase [Nocardioides sp.]